MTIESWLYQVTAKRTAHILDRVHCSHIPGGTLIQQYSQVIRDCYFYFMSNSYKGRLPLGHTENWQQEYGKLPSLSPTKSSPTSSINYRKIFCKKNKICAIFLSAILKHNSAYFWDFQIFPSSYNNVYSSKIKNECYDCWQTSVKSALRGPTCMDHQKM